MRYLKRFSEGLDNRDFLNISQDVEGILIELRDEGKIDFSINSTNEKDLKITFSRVSNISDDDWLFKVSDLIFEVETLEKYLIAYKYKFHYIYEYYDDYDEESLFERCYGISHIGDLCDIAYLNLVIYK